MATPFLGEIRLFSFTVVPKGWIQCNGALLSIAQNQALFSLLGTSYGGDGRTTFAVPDLRGRTPLGTGQGNGLANYVLGQPVGQESVTLTSAQGVAHTHVMNASSDTAGSSTSPGNLLAQSQQQLYGPSGSNAAMSGSAVSVVGGQPHVNTQPSLVIAYCLATQGIFPTRP